MEDVATPEPRPDQVLVRASATSVNRADLGRGPVGVGARPAAPSSQASMSAASLRPSARR